MPAFKTRRLAPAAAILTGVAFGMLCAVAAGMLAISQPYITGLSRADTTLRSIATPDLEPLLLSSDDRVDDPDFLVGEGAATRFFARQRALYERLSSPTVLVARDAAEGGVRVTERRPSNSRPAASLPFDFWLQLGVGVIGWAVGLWVWLLRTNSNATRLFLVNSGGLLLGTLSSAIYSTRQLAIDGDTYWWLSLINHAGAGLYGMSIVALLFVLPNQLAGRRALLALTSLAVGCAVADGLTGTSYRLLNFFLLGCLPLTVIGLGLQWRAARADPRDRAIVRWLATLMIGAVAIPVLTNIAPLALGRPAALPQAYAFVPVLFFHAGLAIGISRFRLFDFDRWAFALIFYLLAAFLLLAMDAGLVSLLAASPPSAFGLAFLAVAFVYLPVRGWIAGRLLRPTASSPTTEQLQRLFDIALLPTDEQEGEWRRLLDDIFAPGLVRPIDECAAPRLVHEGAAMCLPAVGGLSPCLLVHASRGRRLFSPSDLRMAEQLVAGLRHAVEHRDSFAQGVTRERQRISADVHDNLGIQLLSALHSRDAERKNRFIRDAIQNLRDIVNDTRAKDSQLDAHLAELRTEVADLLAMVGVRLDWTIASVPVGLVSPHLVDSLRSIVREAVSNALKHGDPQRVRVEIRRAAKDRLQLTIEDDGRGFTADRVTPGRGLRSVRERAAALGGEVAIVDAAPGTRIDLLVPLGVAA